MKNFKNYPILALIGLAIIAFSCKDADPVGGGPEETPEGGEAYFSMTLNTTGGKAPGTRADTEPGTEVEQEVKNVVVLLYEDKGPDSRLYYKFPLKAIKEQGATEVFKGDDVVDDTHATPPTASRFVSTGQKVEYRDYQMVVLVNSDDLGGTNPLRSQSPQGLRFNLEVGESKLSDINTIFSGPEDFYMMAANGFFMSNANGVVPVTKSQLKLTAKDAETTPVAVNVDRFLAKLRLYKEFPSSYVFHSADEQDTDRWVTSSGMTIGKLGHAPDITNNEAYLIRQYAPFATADAGGPGGNEAYASSVSTSRKHIYAKDANFSGMKSADENDLGVFNKIDISNEYLFYDDIPDYEDRDDSDGYYVMENTMELDDQKAPNYLDYTTQFVIRAIIAPKGYNLGETYYSFVNTGGEPKVFRHEDIVDWIENGLPYPLQIEMAGLLDLANDSDCEFDFTPGSTPGTSFKTSNGITLHADGVNIYRIPIKHFQPTGAMSDPRGELYGYYGVVRNNVYNVVVKTISGPGTGGDSDAYISADITVNEWWVRDQEEDL